MASPTLSEPSDARSIAAPSVLCSACSRTQAVGLSSVLPRPISPSVAVCPTSEAGAAGQLDKYLQPGSIPRPIDMINDSTPNTSFEDGIESARCRV